MIIRNAEIKDRESLEEICFNTRTGSLLNVEDKEGFTYRWVTNYVENFIDFCFVAEDNNEIIGYIVSTPNTEKQEELYYNKSGINIIRTITVLENLLGEYPAHLHINLTSKTRGKGVGTKLIESMENKLIESGIKGVHLGVMADNEIAVSFYKKNGFNVIKNQILDNNQGSVLFMGKILA